ncbi:hypothetical protein PHYBLDRAFT_173636 [Phycomyces blakesleeanus NRRL 1555(-)]|uniref:Uncharacterized protein n=1 Tax=Phycomyces blakesleeanus (strain ATCC 8743b / DSM 1359 / FGSC 10004 / NBRC 33097 / NRRL 1555) TaxID=763407 RepID=A0A167KHY4_PHYB8|nr:hypothetical protein PHYBLDRAFT_173636 [Phycomyces blakesleeanus NRRL 1555(-)]OAD68146.1 hypothetical protein PHYBLDRAFT_173636 [Phycomyces blakesleeanus NRRL 1555(-)]|eukprot:XP_018286186.1 hypothetical protein PHYBLDRAFT_173636 [Phycomyces blakesleeanus NRRL 1555(-)]
MPAQKFNRLCPKFRLDNKEIIIHPKHTISIASYAEDHKEFLPLECDAILLDILLFISLLTHIISYHIFLSLTYSQSSTAPANYLKNTRPEQYDITQYDLVICKKNLTTKSVAHTVLAALKIDLKNARRNTLKLSFWDDLAQIIEKNHLKKHEFQSPKEDDKICFKGSKLSIGTLIETKAVDYQQKYLVGSKVNEQCK